MAEMDLIKKAMSKLAAKEDKVPHRRHV
jgi:hypothetical protein